MNFVENECGKGRNHDRPDCRGTSGGERGEYGACSGTCSFCFADDCSEACLGAREELVDLDEETVVEGALDSV